MFTAPPIGGLAPFVSGARHHLLATHVLANHEKRRTAALTCPSSRLAMPRTLFALAESCSPAAQLAYSCNPYG